MNYSDGDDQSISGQSAASGSGSEVSSQDIAPGPPNAKTLRLSNNRDDDDDDSDSDDKGGNDNDNGISSDDDSGDDEVNVSMDSMAGSMVGEDESDNDDDDGDSDEDVQGEAPPAQFRGKVLRMPVANSDDSDDDSIIAEAEAVTVAVEDDNDDGDGDMSMSMDADASMAEETSIATPMKADDNDDDDDSDSSGDELLISHKSRKKKKKEKEKKVKVRKKPGPKPKKKPGPKPKPKPKAKPKGPRKKPGPKPGKGKKGRKKGEVLAVAVVDDSIAAAVVVDGDKSDESVEGEVVAVAVAMDDDDDASTKVRKKPGPKKGWKKRLAAENAANGVISIVEVAKKKNMKKKKDADADADSDADANANAIANANANGNGNGNINTNANAHAHANGFESDVDATATSTTSVARDRLEAAQAARDVLITSVQNTPFKFSDSHSVRNFGRIKIEDDSRDPLFSSSTALYPVGYSCDRYEFSPVHGRIVKMRCDILDGSKFQDVKEEDMDGKAAHNNVEAGNGKTNCGRGPVFRITWGMGIDELDDGSPFPFDLYSAASPIGNEVDTVAVPLGLDSMNVEPKPAMRVKVRFEGDIWYHGTISGVNMKKEEAEPEKKKRGARSKKGKKGLFNVTINYDDGMTEEVTYPDSDVVLVAPGSESIGGGILNVTEVIGSPVTSVHGKTPLEAWANALIKIGLIDEVMYEKALESISTARIEGVNEVKGRMEALKKQRQEARARQLQKQRDQLGLSPTSAEKDSIDDDHLGLISEDGREPPSEKEMELKKRAQLLLESYKERLAGSRKVAIALADARIQAQDRFLCNPFFDDDASQTHQKNWIAAVIKKEKSKMGSTGNKRKIVTPTDILDRNATFYNTDIERLIEGLPGAEYCGDYMFHNLRGNAGASQNSWMHEAKVRKEKEKVQKRKRAKEDEEKASLEQERERKRKARDDERENRKKQKLEELDQQKQSRKEERLSRLKSQIEDRLFKESCFQRERVVLLASKLCGKEMTRRKKVSEIIAGNVVEFSMPSEENTSFPTYNLPRLSEDFDADIVRLHDFLMTYKSYFCGEDMLTSIPSLDILQSSVNTFSSPIARNGETMEAFNLLNDVGVALCKPLTATLIKTLSSALTTGLQGKNDEENRGEEEDFQDDPDDFHVTRFSWKEVFRLVLLSDVLSEIGLTKIEQTHVLRGYRSGGHPNSKEAKRIRRGEDSALVLRRQGMVFNSNEISQGNEKGSIRRGFTVTVPAPCKPSVGPSHWLYYLHNIKALPSNAATGMKSNLRKACSMLKTSSIAAELDKDSMLSNLESNINLLDQIGTTFTSSSETIQVCKKVRRSILKVLDTATSEIFSSDKSTDFIYRNDCMDSIGKLSERFSDVNFTAKNSRLRSGLLDDLSMSDVEYKKIVQEKEEYLAEAIKFKEEEERKQKVAAGEVDDDDDDDDDEEDDEVIEEKKDTPEDSVTAKISGSPTKEEDNLGRIGKKTEFDEFCADAPRAPELLRRCLAVLRNLCMSSPADTFLYPVDPQANLKYYESVLRPMSLYDVGRSLQNTIQEYQGKWKDICVESVVAEFARKIRIIGKNPICFSPVGGPLISTAEEMLRIFERLFFDWILVPKNLRPALEVLDDEKCVEFHISDEESMVLLCDGCEGKYNMSRLNPPLRSVPKGDWYCNRCRSGYCWASVDPRIGKQVMKSSNDENSKVLEGRITECRVCIPGKGSKNTMHYVVRFENGIEEFWSLSDVDAELKKRGDSVDTIECLEAVTESPGYGCGVESRLPLETVPALLHPKVSDGAAQKFMASSSFRNTVLSSAILLTSDIDGISATEWLQIFNLLVLKCMASDTIQEVASKLESETFSKLNETKSAEVSKIKSIQDILPKLANNENGKVVPTDIPAVVGSGVEGEESASIVELKRQRAVTVKTVKGRRRKREDTFMASAIKKQLKPAISSLEEDNVSRVINNALSSNDEEITFATNRCRPVVCDFCGLSDVTLGSPLFRVPNDEEWEERKDFLIKGRNSLLIAELGNCKPSAMITENLPPTDSGTKSIERTFVTVSIKIGGEVIANEEQFETKDGGVDIMSCGLLPRNKSGFQQELKARADDLLPVPLITGSMSAHECCALAAHKARKEKLLQTAKKKMSHQMELAHGNKCGRTMSIGYDREGRSYWHFESNPGSLFIFVKRTVGASQGKFLRFNSSEIIASVIMSLGRQEISKDLKALFPKAQELLENGTWSRLLQKRAFQKQSNNTGIPQDSDIESEEESAELGVLYDPGDEVLVESSTRKILWDAKVIAAAKKDEDGPIIGYRVKYKDWSSRFDEWVAPSRVFDTSDEHLTRQHNCAAMLAKEPTALPQSIISLVAASFLDSPNRARDLSYMPSFGKILRTPNKISLEDEVLTELKVAVLLIEAALPAGSVKKTGKGIWKPETASYWRSMVNKATTPGDLMGCLVLLETAISKDWLRPNATHLISCLPRSWKSINEASISSISLRLWTLDQGIKYALSRGDDGNWETLEAEEESSDEEE